MSMNQEIVTDDLLLEIVNEHTDGVEPSSYELEYLGVESEELDI